MEGCIGIALITLVAWLVLGNQVSQAFTASVSVLVIACPCALGLATPTALLAGTTRGSQLGILIKTARALEDTRRVDTVVLDKTGTLTEGNVQVVQVHPLGKAEPVDTVLLPAAAVEAYSEHPIAQAISAAGAAHGELPTVQDFRSSPGGGVRGIVDTQQSSLQVLVGQESFMTTEGVELSADQRNQLTTQQERGYITVIVAIDGAAVGLISLQDTPKPEAGRAISQLRSLGLAPILLTGDAAPVAKAVAGQVGIGPESVLAGASPHDKVAALKELQARGQRVAMVGDGVNDAAALAQADLGIAMASGSDVALEAADITVMGNDLTSVATAIRLSRATLRLIRSNLLWAFGYNALAVPIAAVGLLNPMLAGAAMAFSSVFVVLNSLRLSRFR